ncbi:MAG TPA: hypothetical protein VLD60_07455 [Nitrospira sp.]|nr:hypothetical protein [Nitrospira sp.]
MFHLPLTNPAIATGCVRDITTGWHERQADGRDEREDVRGKAEGGTSGTSGKGETGGTGLFR